MSAQQDTGSPKGTKPSVAISLIQFSGGDEIELGPNDKVMIVGANNSGKSKSIREMIQLLSKQVEPENTVVVKGITINKQGSIDDFRDYLRTKGTLRSNHYVIGDWLFHPSNTFTWQQEMLAGGLSEGFIRNVDASSRLGICKPQASLSPEQNPAAPQHLLYQDDALMAMTSGLFKRAFGQELLIDFRGGSQIPIHVGETPKGPGYEDRISKKYIDAVRSYPLLHEQGDGMQSFAGILFQTVVSKRDLTFIDEPEAFLHPPQMRRLGEILSTSIDKQLIVATHSSDILRGFLEGRRGAIRILRIQREKNVNKIYEATPSAIEALWTTPTLRFSSALESIFHEQAIICEDDSDCRLFNSVADHLQESCNDTWPDTAYVPMGGKSGIAKVARTLRAIGVPVKAIYDFDLVSTKDELRIAVDAFGGDWTDILVLWKRVSAAVDAFGHPTNAKIKQNLREILDRSGEQELPRKEMDEAIRRRSPWSKVKSNGLNGIPRGEVRATAELLVEKLSQIGIYLVPGGEIESFCPTVGGHGPSFVTTVLATISLGDPRLQALRDFTMMVHKGTAGAIEPAGTIEQRAHRASVEQDGNEAAD
jgi:hypothetical protein